MTRIDDAPAAGADDVPWIDEPDEPAPESRAEPLHGGEPGAERRNFIWLVAQQVLFRIGWVFKTESIVMPYFLDLVGGGPVLRSWLMVLNRLGASLPPMLYARRLKLTPQKRWRLLATTTGAAAPFAAMSLLWASGVWRDPAGEPAWWTRWFFLAMYGWFFAVIGLNQLSVQTVQGKLVRADRRGRLFAAGVVCGAPLAILAVVVLMPGWLALPDGGFGWVFAAPAVAFALSGLTMLGVREAPDSFTEEHESGWRRIRRAVRLAAHNPRVRPVAIAALLYSSAFTLFPHYQALAVESAGDAFDVRSLVTWTVTQHTAVAVISLLAGPIADRFGTRHAVQMAMFGSGLAPLTAIAIALFTTAGAGQPFWLVFLPLGFTPVTNKMLLNYTLEATPREEHAVYVRAIGLCLSLPVIVGSPIVGGLVVLLGAVPVFAGGALVLMAAAAQTLTLEEHRRAPAG